MMRKTKENLMIRTQENDQKITLELIWAFYAQIWAYLLKFGPI